MVEMVHVSSSLRLTRTEGSSCAHVRTFSGVRENLEQRNVSDFLSGINGLVARPATNAAHTRRAAFVAV